MRFRRWLAGVIDPQGQAVAQKLYDHLRGFSADLHDLRYTDAGPCPGCFDAVYEYEAWTR